MAKSQREISCARADNAGMHDATGHLFDTIIIGAGAAGLAAAHTLSAAGRSHIVLEARDRIGGRVISHRDGFGVSEDGAEFIHGEHAVTWEWVQKAGLQTEAYASEAQTREGGARIFGLDGRLLIDGKFEQDVQHWHRLLDGYDGADVSLQDWYANHTPQHIAAQMAMLSIARIEAADPGQLSAKWLAHEHRVNTSGPTNFRVPTGYDQVMNAMASTANIRLECAVERISWNDDGVSVHHRYGVSRNLAINHARQVIVTIPLSLLQLGMIAFTPPLPATKRGAIAALRMGSVVKLVLHFSQAFWPAHYFLSTNGMLTTWWPLGGTLAPALMCFTAGPAALQLGALGETGIVEQALRELSAYFATDVRRFLRGHRMTDWSNDPWARGAYSYTPVGAGDAREALAESIGPLHFAGEATVWNGHHGTVHGAIESGVRAAQAVIG